MVLSEIPLLTRWPAVNTQDPKDRRPFSTAGQKLDDVIGDTAKRIEEETKQLIAYIDDELAGGVGQTEGTGRLHGVGQAAEKRLITRLPLLSVAAAGMLLLTACGGHKNASSKKVPPPPTIAAAPALPPAATAKAEPKSNVPPPSKAKPIYVETGLASWY